MASKRRTFSRFLILLLIGSIIALVVRACGERSDQLVAIDELEADELFREDFTVHKTATLVVDCVGSLQSDTTLAAYGWIIRGDTHEVVWQLDPAFTVRSRGMLAAYSGAIELQPGPYSAFFAGFGDPDRPRAIKDGFFDKVSSLIDPDFERWRTESAKWQFIVRLSADSPEDAASPGFYMEDEKEAAYLNLRDVSSDEYLENAITVSEAIELPIRAIGEFNREPLDYAWISNLRTGERIWTMTEENTSPAGGGLRNRVFDGEVKLIPGQYIIGYQSDSGHNPFDWDANPPLDVDSWGLRVGHPISGSMAPFDPWMHLPKIAEVTRLGDDDVQGYGIELETPLRVWVEATGEGRGNMFDYGWIVKKGDSEPLWKMEFYDTDHAGGDDKNRHVTAILDLDPGKFGIFFRTDESHAYNAWNADPPDNPERFGITLFSMDPERTPPGRPLHTDSETGEVSEAVLVSLRRLGNGQQLEAEFTLDKEGEVSVVAVGEILLSDRYDYGWISKGERIVWEMTRENTEYAGGANKNRRAEVTLNLDVGTYVAHFVTDESHAYGDFSERPPDYPAHWGIEIRSLDLEKQEQEWDTETVNGH